MVVIFNIEACFAKGEDLKTAQPVKWAKSLYDGFRSQNHTVGLTQADPEIVRWWLKREHLDNWSLVVSYPDTSAYSWDQWRVDQVRDFLAEGWEVFAYVDAPSPIMEEIGAFGIATIAVGYPTMAVGWKEVAAPRAWASVVGKEA